MSILGLDCDLEPRPVAALLSRGVPSPLTNPRTEMQLGGAAACQIVTPSGDALALDELRRRLGLSRAPLILSGLGVVLEFFRTELRTSPFAWISQLRGIDFHSPVSVQLLPAARVLARHKWINSGPLGGSSAATSSSSVAPSAPKESKPFVYLANSGLAPSRTGTNFEMYSFERYETTMPVLALQSVASSLSFGDTPAEWRVSRPGGDVQFIVSLRSFNTLKRVP